MPATGPDSIIETGLLLRQRDRHHAAVGAHHLDLAAEARAAQIGFQPPQIALHPRSDIGVQHGCRGALIFAVFAQDFVRKRDEQVRHHLTQNRADALFMQRDWHRNGADRPRPLRRRARATPQPAFRLRTYRAGISTAPFASDPLRRFERQLALDQRLGTMEKQIERFDTIASPDRIDVAEALGGDQRRACALALQNRVDGDRRAVQHFGKCRHVAIGKRERVGDAARRIGGNGGGFGGDDTTVDTADEVGERAADIHSDNVHTYFQRVKRRSATRTSSFKPIAMMASVAISAKSGAGSKVSANSLVK
jgi:hypothetical protein